MLNLEDILERWSPEKKKSAEEEVVKEMGVEEKVEEVKELNNESILEYVAEHFKQQMKKKSFRKVVTFPMSFTIILNKKDYEGFQEYSGVVSKYIIYEFYDIIKKELTEGKVCENLATYWNISFLQCDDEPVEINGKMVQVNEGEYYIFCCVHDKLSETVAKGTGGSTISVSKGGSKLYADININMETLNSLKIVGQTHFQMTWDPMMSNVFMSTETPIVENVSSAVAKLCCQGKEYMMTGGTYKVSGLDEKQKDKNTFIVDSEFVENGHIMIEYIAEENKFKIAAFAETELNGRDMPISTAGDKKWSDLQDGMTINLAGDVILTFKKLI
ncbi:MAG: hypothetical protein J6C92_14135 [Bacteroidaceae bacterium]|nr:hypothetical protein [Bacteroidaceae bacterium]